MLLRKAPSDLLLTSRLTARQILKALPKSGEILVGHGLVVERSIPVGCQERIGLRSQRLQFGQQERGKRVLDFGGNVSCLVKGSFQHPCHS